MTEHKFTDEEIIEALKCCGEIDSKYCDICTYRNENDCILLLAKNAFDLINRQRAEIDDLTRDTIPKLKNGLERANKYGAELDKEFAELKQKYDLAVAEREANVKALIEKTAEVERLATEKDNLIRTYAECQKDIVEQIFKQIFNILRNYSYDALRVRNNYGVTQVEHIFMDILEFKKKYTEEKE